MKIIKLGRERNVKTTKLMDRGSIVGVMKRKERGGEGREGDSVGPSDNSPSDKYCRTHSVTALSHITSSIITSHHI